MFENFFKNWIGQNKRARWRILKTGEINFFHTMDFLVFPLSHRFREDIVRTLLILFDRRINKQLFILEKIQEYYDRIELNTVSVNRHHTLPLNFLITK